MAPPAHDASTIAITRASVAAGDDADAPHETHVVAGERSRRSALEALIAEGYLPTVAGQAHGWVLRDPSGIAIGVALRNEHQIHWAAGQAVAGPVHIEYRSPVAVDELLALVR